MHDKDEKAKVKRHLSIIGGQVNGLANMVDDDAYCIDVLTQIAAVQQSLRSVGKKIVRHHIETCVTKGIRGKQPEKSYEELMDIIYKYSK